MYLEKLYSQFQCLAELDNDGRIDEIQDRINGKMINNYCPMDILEELAIFAKENKMFKIPTHSQYSEIYAVQVPGITLNDSPILIIYHTDRFIGLLDKLYNSSDDKKKYDKPRSFNEWAHIYVPYGDIDARLLIIVDKYNACSDATIHIHCDKEGEWQISHNYFLFSDLLPSDKIVDINLQTA